jgi:hypothetical protein
MRTNTRQLSDRLGRANDAGKGLRFSPGEVNVALAALRSATATAINNPGDQFQIELLGADGWPLAVLATINDELLARAVFARAVGEGRQRIRLRVGSRVLLGARPA